MSDYIVHKAIELSNISAKVRKEVEEITEWVISPKYDGCHAIFTFYNGKHVATYSRTGETVLSMPHIAKSLLDLYPIHEGRIAIQGEAWIVGKEFSYISGVFRRQSPQPELMFVPFDIVPFDFNTDAVGPPVLLGQLNNRLYPAPYKKRIAMLRDKRAQILSNVICPMAEEYSFVNLTEAKDAADAIASHYKNQTFSHYDGAVLAQANGKYQVGSGKGGEFIKCKPLLSETVKVSAVVSDIGGKTGKNTCVLCFNLNGAIQKVSTGLSQAQADEYTLYPERIIDQYIEVEAMGLTTNGLLREPRFKGIRTDA